MTARKATDRIKHLSKKVGRDPSDLMGDHVKDAQVKGAINPDEAAELNEFLAALGGSAGDDGVA